MEEVNGQNPGMNQNPQMNQNSDMNGNQESSGSKKWWIIGISIFVIILITAGLVWWLFFTGGSDTGDVDSGNQEGASAGAGAVNDTGMADDEGNESMDSGNVSASDSGNESAMNESGMNESGSDSGY